MEMAGPLIVNGKNKTPIYRLDMDTSREKKEGQAIGDMETYNTGRTKGSGKDMV